jgi:hypothetical protein
MADDDFIPMDDEPLALEPDESPGGEKHSAAKDDDDEPIRLVETEGEPNAQLRAFGAAALGGAKAEQYKRQLNVDGHGATRCRVFHSKISLTPLEHMENTINQWLDSGDIEIKHVGHVIGTMEGKRPEPNLIVMVWY